MTAIAPWWIWAISLEQTWCLDYQSLHWEGAWQVLHYYPARRGLCSDRKGRIFAMTMWTPGASQMTSVKWTDRDNVFQTRCQRACHIRDLTFTKPAHFDFRPEVRAFMSPYYGTIQYHHYLKHTSKCRHFVKQSNNEVHRLDSLFPCDKRCRIFVGPACVVQMYDISPEVPR